MRVRSVRRYLVSGAQIIFLSHGRRHRRAQLFFDHHYRNISTKHKPIAFTIKDRIAERNYRALGTTYN